MNAQEQQLIDELVDRVRSTQPQSKDAEAEQRLQQGLGNFPDALYLLAQTVIVQKYGLEQAQDRMQQMQTELDALRGQASRPQTTPASSGSSFLSHIFGGGSPSPQAPPPSGLSQQGGWQPVNNSSYPQGGYPSVPGAYPPPGAYPSAGYGQPGGWSGSSPFGGGGGGFLQGALQTAAGVAIGEMAVESIGSLFHGFGGGGFGRGFEGDRLSETAGNRFDAGDTGRHSDGESGRDGNSGANDDTSFYNPHHDASREGEAHAFAGAGSPETDRGDSLSGDSGDDFSGDSGDYSSDVADSSDDFSGDDADNDDGFDGNDDGGSFSSDDES